MFCWIWNFIIACSIQKLKKTILVQSWREHFLFINEHFWVHQPAPSHTSLRSSTGWRIASESWHSRNQLGRAPKKTNRFVMQSTEWTPPIWMPLGGNHFLSFNFRGDIGWTGYGVQLFQLHRPREWQRQFLMTVIWSRKTKFQSRLDGLHDVFRIKISTKLCSTRDERRVLRNMAIYVEGVEAACNQRSGPCARADNYGGRAKDHTLVVGGS